MERDNIKNAGRIVIKVGTSVLCPKNDLFLDHEWINSFTKQIIALIRQHREIVVVSSGAIASGMSLLGIKKRPHNLPELQACAAIGQNHLMNIYEDSFKKYGYHAAQILLTWEDMRNRRRYLNAENTIRTLLGKKAVPIINENDTVSVDEIKFGDNDSLSALVANLIDADLLVMLTDVEGLCIGEVCIDVVSEIDSKVERAASGTDKECSLGGMKAKLDACKIALNSGIYCVIANGRKQDVLSKILKGEKIGTMFLPKKARMKARKRWIASSAKVEGRIIVDDGAKEAVVKKNKSLLAIGVKTVEGKFVYGDVVELIGTDGKAFARGLSNYSSLDLDRIKGLSTKEVEKLIEEGFYEEVIHRDNLVIL